MFQKNISVIICTWNNSKRLEITLNAFLECVIPLQVNWEVVVVNNNSTDNTDEIINNFSDKLPLKYVFEKKQGKSVACNTGLEASTGELIIFADDDIRPAKDWICSYWDAFLESSGQAFFGGPIESEFEGQVPEPDLLECAPYSVKGYDLGQYKIMLKKQQTFLGANWACPRKAFDVVGRFDVEKGLDPFSGTMKAGEETDIMMRLKKVGMQGIYLPQARIKHFVPQNKCTLEHIILRSEASAYSSIGDLERKWNLPLIGRVPIEIYLRLVKAFVLYQISRIMRKKSYKEYQRFKYAVGYFKGFRDQKLNPSEKN